MTVHTVAVSCHIERGDAARAGGTLDQPGAVVASATRTVVHCPDGLVVEAGTDSGGTDAAGSP